MNTCGTCKYRGKELDGAESGFFLCDLIEHKKWKEDKITHRAFVEDGSGYYAALCVSNDFGCVEWTERTRAHR